MFFVPLSQLQSVELLVHSLKAAAGEADCTMCPAYRVCMKQCQTIANSIEQMLQHGTLPQANGVTANSATDMLDEKPKAPPSGSSGKGGLRIVK